MKARAGMIAVIGVVLMGLPNLGLAQNVFGPGYYGGYIDNPVGPTVSPYVLLGRDQSGVSNYYTLVKPLEQQQEVIREHGSDLRRLQSDVRKTASSSRSNVVKGMRSTGVAPDQRDRRYQNYSHYFNLNSNR